jgi:hypothetical protein
MLWNENSSSLLEMTGLIPSKKIELSSEETVAS